jgi:hypothetical protein
MAFYIVKLNFHFLPSSICSPILDRCVGGFQDFQYLSKDFVWTKNGLKINILYKSTDQFRLAIPAKFVHKNSNKKFNGSETAKSHDKS